MQTTKPDHIQMKQNTCLITVPKDQVKFWEDQGFAVVKPPASANPTTKPEEK